MFLHLINAASFLNGFKNIPEKACPSGLRTMVPIVRGELLACKKNKLCLISILYIKNTNEESVLLGYKAHARDTLSLFRKAVWLMNY